MASPSQFDFLFGLEEGLYYLVLAGYPNNYVDGFFVFLDDEQATDLDAALSPAPDSTLLFVRLVPLVGG